MRIRRLAATGAVLALSLGVVGCNGGEEEPTAAPSTTAEETTDAETTEPAETSEAAPDVPKPDPADYPGKDEQTEEGAKQATRYYWAMLFWGYQTGETAELEKLFGERCGNCLENVQAIGVSAEKKSYWSEVSAVDDNVVAQRSDSFDYEIAYNFTLGKHQQYNVKEDRRIEVPEQYYATGAGVNWRDGAWVVDGINFEVEDS